VECEAVARLKRKIATPVQFENPAGLTQSADYCRNGGYHL